MFTPVIINTYKVVVLSAPSPVLPIPVSMYLQGYPTHPAVSEQPICSFEDETTDDRASVPGHEEIYDLDA